MKGLRLLIVVTVVLAVSTGFAADALPSWNDTPAVPVGQRSIPQLASLLGFTELECSPPGCSIPRRHWDMDAFLFQLFPAHLNLW
jgi:hypothetical protein